MFAGSRRLLILQEVTLEFDTLLPIARLVESAIAVIFALVMLLLVWLVYRKLTDILVLLQFIRDHIHKEEINR